MEEQKQARYKIYGFTGVSFTRSEVQLPDNLESCYEIVASLEYDPVQKLKLSAPAVTFEFFSKPAEMNPNRIKNHSERRYACVQTIGNHSEVIKIESLPALNAFLKYASELINAYAPARKG